MLETIEKLLILQDRDRKIYRLKGELADIGPQRRMFESKTADSQKILEQAKERVKQLESERKTLELEVETKKEQIVKYANQQFQTRKNDEYRALAQEIEHCKAQIRDIEDRQLELMEQIEAAQKGVVQANQTAAEARKVGESQLAQLAQREESLKKDLASLELNREELAGAVAEGDRTRYERLFRSKGDNVVVGVQHGVCGGCHMRLPPQLVVSCQAEKELVTCINCGRILYYTQDMDLAVAE